MLLVHENKIDSRAKQCLFVDKRNIECMYFQKQEDKFIYECLQNYTSSAIINYVHCA